MGNFTSAIMRARLHPPQRTENAQTNDATTQSSNDGNTSNGNAAAATTRNGATESPTNTESDTSTARRGRGTGRYNLRATPARQTNASPSPSSTTTSVLGRRSRQEAFQGAGQEGTGIDARNRILQHLVSQEARDREQSDQPTIHFSFQYTDPEAPSEPTTVMVNVQLQNQQQGTEVEGEEDNQRPTFMFNIYYLQPTHTSGDTATAGEQPSSPLEHIDQNRLLRQTFLNFYLIMHAANADRILSYEELTSGCRSRLGPSPLGLTPRPNQQSPGQESSGDARFGSQLS